jgi:hypothetical protein
LHEEHSGEYSILFYTTIIFAELSECCLLWVHSLSSIQSSQQTWQHVWQLQLWQWAKRMATTITTATTRATKMKETRAATAMIDVTMKMEATNNCKNGSLK